MPAERAGYTLVVYAIDVSPSMGDAKLDPALSESSSGSSSSKEKSKTKLDLAKEFVARRCEPKISSGRKTEAIGVVSFGGKTNNQAHRAWMTENPDDEDPPYAAVACDVAIQSAKPKIVEEVMNLGVGNAEGNPVSAVMVALDMIHTHKHTKAWALEIMLVTDGESAFKQDEYEDAMARFDDMGVKLTVVGIDFAERDAAVEKTKSRNKRLAEKFWRTFVQMLYDRMSPTTSSEEILPDYRTFDQQLIESRMPRPAVVNGTVSGIDLRIGSIDVDPEQAIVIPIKYSKATMKARPPSLSKAWKPAMDLQGTQRSSAHVTTTGASSQLANSVAEQSQALNIPPNQNDLAAMISADVKHYSTYVIKKQPEKEKVKVPDSQVGLDPIQVEGSTQVPQEEEDGAGVEEDEEEEVVAKEDIVKAWRFGSTWVPMEKDTFEPLDTQKGVDILTFIPRDSIKRHLLMGEVRFVWPDMSSPRAQIAFSSLVEGMALRDMVAVVRWVLKDQADPIVGLCVPEMEYPGEDKRLDYMFWIRLPFAEDEHNFWFPSLTTYKTSTGKVVTEHPLLPTDEQSDLMDAFVEAMDLDKYAERKRKEEKERGEANGNGHGEEDGDQDEDMDAHGADDNEGPTRWFEPTKSYNPVIHRIKEAIFHASLTQDLDADPLGPPHPELTKYFYTPQELADETEDVTGKLKESLKVKKVPPKVRRKKMEKEELRADEGFIDIDELFQGEGEAESSSKGKAKAEPFSPQKAKKEPISPSKSRRERQGSSSEESDILPPPPTKSTPAKPKRGRLISNENPLEDFNKLVEGEGDVFRKAIQDLGAVVKENVEASFSRQAFPRAIECLQAMRSTALTYEEVETYNEYLDDLEKTIKAPGFKHKDFWDDFEKAGQEVARITSEEAREALEGYDE